MSAGKTNEKLRFRGEKGKGVKGLIIASILVINFAPPVVYLYDGEKMNLNGEEGGGSSPYPAA